MTPIATDKHSPVTGFDVTDDGQLLIAQRTVSELCQQYGTPLYVYDGQQIVKRTEQLRQQLPSDIDLHYAIKANPHPDVVRLLAQHTDGLDVASSKELAVALDAGGNPEHISFAGPGKRDSELQAALEAGIVINIESERELEVLARLGTTQGLRPRIAVRINPPFQLKTSGMKMGGGSQQFGIDSERVPAVLNAIGQAGAEFIGFHIFSGSQNLRPEAICEAQQRSVELAGQLAAAAPSPVRLLNIGGGFGVPYFPGEQPLDLAPIAANLERLKAEAKKTMPQSRLTLELGRYFVAEAGVYLCQVIDRKVSRGQVFLVTDGGLHHHLAASGNFGQVLRKNYPVTIANRIGAEKSETASVVGPLCTPLDLLADRMQLPVAQPGDIVAVFQSGAYGFTASPRGFLSHPEPKELVI